MSLKTIILIQQEALAVELMKQKDFHIIEAGDCVEGLRLIIRHQPDLVISVMKMPAFNGITMAEIMELFLIPAPVIFTSNSFKDQRRMNELSGPHGFITDDDIAAGLLPMAKEKLSLQPKEQRNLNYSLRQREWADLSSKDERKRILIVDDSEWIQKACMKTLDELDNYALFSANDGLEAIIKALLIEPDLIITDLHMPKLDGLVMSQILYILNQPFPIVFLTADEDHQLYDQTKRVAGILGVVMKKELRNAASFHQKVGYFLGELDKCQEEIAQEFQKGDPKLLEENQVFLEGKGLCTPGNYFKPGSHHIDALRKGNGGMGAFFARNR